MSTTKYLRIRGHRITHSRSGANDAYARGHCECGWKYPGWTHYRSAVTQSHQNHLWTVKNQSRGASK